MLEYCKLQIGCMLVIIYIAFVYCEERRRFNQHNRFSLFDLMLSLGILTVLFDGATAYTVNHLDIVDSMFIRVLHLLFLLGLDSFIFCLFLYMLSITTGLPKSRHRKILLYGPFVINVLLVIIYIPELKYYEGAISNYSMGMSAYTCFIMAGVYILLSLVIFFGRWHYIEKHKRMSIFTYLAVMVCITAYQMLHPQSLLSSIGLTVIIVGAYVNQENPTVAELGHYHNEMIMGFATLVENKDGSTGGHIKRTTTYVKLLAEELRHRGYYRKELTKDFMKNLYMAAPMHDIGKISIPDVILQKPARLTEEEFATIKTHAEKGGQIIRETYGNLGNEAYAQMAYEVARFHHEKWNGKGYPDGLKCEEIPLAARIMAIADVFDALSEKRCYKEAMPMDKCFEIIQEGRGQDFDPVLVDVFLDIRPQVELAYQTINRK